MDASDQRLLNVKGNSLLFAGRQLHSQLNAIFRCTTVDVLVRSYTTNTRTTTKGRNTACGQRNSNGKVYLSTDKVPTCWGYFLLNTILALLFLASSNHAAINHPPTFVGASLFTTIVSFHSIPYLLVLHPVIAQVSFALATGKGTTSVDEDSSIIVDGMPEGTKWDSEFWINSPKEFFSSKYGTEDDSKHTGSTSRMHNAASGATRTSSGGGGNEMPTDVDEDDSEVEPNEQYFNIGGEFPTYVASEGWGSSSSATNNYGTSNNENSGLAKGTATSTTASFTSGANNDSKSNNDVDYGGAVVSGGSKGNPYSTAGAKLTAREKEKVASKTKTQWSRTSARGAAGAQSRSRKSANNSIPNWRLNLDQKFKYHICRVETTATIEMSLTVRERSGVVWRGWGTTLGWFAMYVGGLAPRKFNYVMDLLFHKERGVGLNIARYAIPGGNNLKYTPRARYRGKVFFPPGYQQKWGGPFNWSADPQQRRVLLGARDRGADTFEAIVYSPPWWMTVSGDVAGNVGGMPNLRRDAVDDYANYIATIIERFKRHSKWNITFDTVSPFNEAMERWWRKGGGQEGCGFDMETAAGVIRSLRAQFSRRQLETSVVGFDSWPSTTRTYLSARWRTAEFRRALEGLKTVSIHGYRGRKVMMEAADAKDFLTASDAARKLGKSIWQSEWGPLGFNGGDLDMSLFMARNIIQHINLLKVEAWLHYQAASWNNFSWGLVRLQFRYNKPFRLFISRQFWIMKHFTKWIQPGSLPLTITSNCAHTVAAAYNGKEKVLSIMVVNQRDSDRVLRFKLNDFRQDGKLSRVEVYRTSYGEFYKRISSREGAMPTTVEIPCKANSFTTYVIKGIEYFV